MQITTSARGFDYHQPVPSQYGGQVSVSESSNAEYAGVWLRTEDTCGGQEMVETALNLTAENAWTLARQLADVVVHHYQGDGRPVDDYQTASDALAAVLNAYGLPSTATSGAEVLSDLAAAGFVLMQIRKPSDA